VDDSSISARTEILRNEIMLIQYEERQQRNTSGLIALAHSHSIKVEHGLGRALMLDVQSSSSKTDFRRLL
jgi:hypothetical protein